jgi:rod shape-determining protein MreD
MTDLIRSVIALLCAFIAQVTVFPAVLADPFRPNLLLITVVWISLTASSLWGAAVVYLLGLVQDSVSGLYLGLNGFNYLLTFLMLHGIANRLYADSRYLMTLAVFAASVVCGLSQLLLLALFSSAGGIVTTLLASLIPQSLVNALVASLIFSLLDRSLTGESG